MILFCRIPIAFWVILAIAAGAAPWLAIGAVAFFPDTLR